jgi:hypothetical protein
VATLEDLLAEANSDPDIDIMAATIDVVIPAADKPGIDDLITAPYTSSDIAKTMLSSLRDPDSRVPKAAKAVANNSTKTARITASKSTNSS